MEPGDDPCCFTYSMVLEATPDPLVNEASVAAEDVFGQPVEAGPAIAEVNIVHPSFEASKDCRTEPLQPGDIAIFDITIENTGDICLHFDVCDIDPCSFDLPAGQTKTYETYIQAGDDDVSNTLNGTATLCDPCECIPYEEAVEASDECSVSGGATRTPGFWKTHYYLAQYTLEEHCVDINLGWTNVDDVNVMMAIFWEKKAHKDALCKARIHGAFHAMAAALNNCHPDGLSLAGYMSANCSEYSPEDIPAIMGGCDIDDIKDLTSCLAGYNEEGDDVEITFPEGLEAYNAQPKYAREQAEGLFPQADCDDCDEPTITPTKVKGPKPKGATATSGGGGKGKGKK
jgi:hypothetical protein